MPSPARRLVPLFIALTLIAGLAPATAAADPTDLSTAAFRAAERRALILTNKRRTDRGLVTLRWDERLAELARDRATYMAETGRFSHTQSGGTSVFDLIEASSIRWYGAGEIIAWNTAASLDYSADFAVQGWMGSPSHKAIVISSGYNYVGFGVAVSPETGKRYWAGVYLKGPDRTAASVKIKTWSRTNVDRRYARVTLRWYGKDIRLQVLTSGLRYFQVQRRRDSGAWYDYGRTTATYLKTRWLRGHRYELRVRSRDRAGNWSRWVTKVYQT
ncbi:MAG: CAP domain-containing protein [Candidatus Limnocylindrales bacterium]